MALVLLLVELLVLVLVLVLVGVAFSTRTKNDPGGVCSQKAPFASFWYLPSGHARHCT
jgi:hypothetical protein